MADTLPKWEDTESIDLPKWEDTEHIKSEETQSLIESLDADEFGAEPIQNDDNDEFGIQPVNEVSTDATPLSVVGTPDPMGMLGAAGAATGVDKIQRNVGSRLGGLSKEVVETLNQYPDIYKNIEGFNDIGDIIEGSTQELADKKIQSIANKNKALEEVADLEYLMDDYNNLAESIQTKGIDAASEADELLEKHNIAIPRSDIEKKTAEHFESVGNALDLETLDRAKKTELMLLEALKGNPNDPELIAKTKSVQSMIKEYEASQFPKNIQKYMTRKDIQMPDYVKKQIKEVSRLLKTSPKDIEGKDLANLLATFKQYADYSKEGADLFKDITRSFRTQLGVLDNKYDKLKKIGKESIDLQEQMSKTLKMGGRVKSSTPLKHTENTIKRLEKSFTTVDAASLDAKSDIIKLLKDLEADELIDKTQMSTLKESLKKVKGKIPENLTTIINTLDDSHVDLKHAVNQYNSIIDIEDGLRGVLKLTKAMKDTEPLSVSESTKRIFNNIFFKNKGSSITEKKMMNILQDLGEKDLVPKIKIAMIKEFIKGKGVVNESDLINVGLMTSGSPVGMGFGLGRTIRKYGARIQAKLATSSPLTKLAARAPLPILAGLAGYGLTRSSGASAGEAGIETALDMATGANPLAAGTKTALWPGTLGKEVSELEDPSEGPFAQIMKSAELRKQTEEMEQEDLRKQEFESLSQQALESPLIRPIGEEESPTAVPLAQSVDTAAQNPLSIFQQIAERSKMRDPEVQKKKDPKKVKALSRLKEAVLVAQKARGDSSQKGESVAAGDTKVKNALQKKGLLEEYSKLSNQRELINNPENLEILKDRLEQSDNEKAKQLYSDQLDKAMSAGREQRKTIIFNLYQQPGFRKLVEQEK